MICTSGRIQCNIETFSFNTPNVKFKSVVYY